MRSLSSELNRSSTILRSMVEGVAVVDAQERVVFSNRAFSEILNLDPSLIEGRPLIEVVRHSDLLGLIRRVLRGEEGSQIDIAMGIVQQRSFSVTATPVQTLEVKSPASQLPAITTSLEISVGTPSGAVVVLHDVTELRRLERVRQDFVANVSHEFKTPLTAIQGFAETLLAGALDDRPEQPPIPRDYPRPCRAPGPLDRRLVEARPHRGGKARSGVPSRRYRRTDRTLPGNHFAQGRPQTDRAGNADSRRLCRWCAATRVCCARCCRIFLDNAVQYTPPGRPDSSAANRRRAGRRHHHRRHRHRNSAGRSGKNF